MSNTDHLPKNKNKTMSNTDLPPKTKNDEQHEGSVLLMFCFVLGGRSILLIVFCFERWIRVAHRFLFWDTDLPPKTKNDEQHESTCQNKKR
jgi:hypothetical protein